MISTFTAIHLVISVILMIVSLQLMLTLCCRKVYSKSPISGRILVNTWCMLAWLALNILCILVQRRGYNVMQRNINGHQFWQLPATLPHAATEPHKTNKELAPIYKWSCPVLSKNMTYFAGIRIMFCGTKSKRRSVKQLLF